MKIAIVAPSPVPFTVGGAEKLWWGILEYLNKNTNHQCELIKIPVKEDTFWNLIDSYYKFYSLDLSHFDMIISTKYPAWMVQHHNHHLYMFHCLRGLYDTYHFTGLLETIEIDNKKILKLLKLIDNNEELPLVFNELFELKNDNSIPQELFIFPGPLVRKIVHYFDKKAMKKVKNFFALSQTVIDRKDYFPDNVKVKKIYSPTHLDGLKNESYNYFFTASRLDGPKRVKDIILAYKEVETNIPLKIAGTGPLMEELKELAKNDQRIEFLGFVSDEKLTEYYANSYAVIFIPYDEDYGLITIEAMMCEKPVITYSDSGGVTEFVEHEVTGLISKPNIEYLAQNIEYLAKNPDLCKKMGKEAKKKVSKITWKNLIKKLLDEDNNSFNIVKKSKDKITVVVTYPVYPPRGGGQNRIFYLYKEIAKFIKVDIICLVNENESYKKLEIAPNLYEIRIPKTKEHAQKEWEIEKNAGILITDIAMLYLYEKTPLFIEEIKKSIKDSKYIISTQPYPFPLIKKYVEIPIIHDSQNVEYGLKKQMLKSTVYNQKLLNKLFEVEKEASLSSHKTTVCSFEDAVEFEKTYGFKKEEAILVPNGVDLESVPFVSKQERRHLKKSLGIEKQKIVLFIGSWHQPNIEATEVVFNIAKKLPHYSFIILGSVGEYFKSKTIEIPKNIGFAGIVSDEEKKMYLSVADIAINPMLSGSGTNLKMLDYMASGIPVVSTKVGARGLNIPKDYMCICDVKEFDYYILNVEKFTNIQKSREYMENTYDWKIIAKNFLKIII